MDTSQTDTLLRNIITRTSDKHGQAYLESMVLALEQAIGADYVFIGKILTDEQIETVAICRQGKMISNLRYGLPKAPCENVFNKQTCIYPRRVFELFPEDQMLREMGIEGYIGTPLFDQKRQPIGLAVGLFEQPILHAESNMDLFNVLSAAIGKELELELTLQALRKSEAEYRSLSDNLPLVVYKAEDQADKPVHYLNSYIKALTGYDKSVFLTGKLLFSSLVHPEDQPKVFKKKQAAYQETLQLSYRLQHKDGSWKSVEEISRCIGHTAEGTPIRQGYIRDVTEQVKREQTLLKLNSELDNFVYKVSHDLRAPIATSIGLLNLIHAEQIANSATQPYLDMMETSLHRLDKYIRDILDYSRNNRLEITIEEIDLLPLIREIHQDLANPKDHFELDAPAAVHLFSDPIRVRTVLNNLISNAFKFRKMEKGHQHQVSISLQPQQGGVEVKISDNGEGIHCLYQDRVFDMFFRSSDQHPGSGLGLYIVRESLQRISGQIHLSSEPTKGSTFAVFFPHLTYLV